MGLADREQGTAVPADVRRTALVAGCLYLLTFVTSIPTLALYRPLRDRADFVLGAGGSGTVTAGVLLEVVLALACAGTAVALVPVVRRYSEPAALGFLAARVVEAALILVGVAALLALLSLREDAAGADPDALRAVSGALLAVYDGTFLLGQSLMPVVSALCLGSVLYRSRLVPRLIPAVGLAGAPLLLLSDVAILTGVYEQGTPLAGLAALPIAAWELALGCYLVARGFRPAALTGLQRPAERGAAPRSPVPLG